MNFLRAESGAYLIASRSGLEAQQAIRREFLHSSPNGHYTPLAFRAEFEFAKLAGTNGDIWRARQIAVLAMVATAVFAFGCAVGSMFRLTRPAAMTMAAALAASVAFQPAMADFISWPFMVLQLVWMACAVATLLALLKFARSPALTRWAWIAALAAYASMHVSGLGLVVVIATSTAICGIVAVEMRHGAANAKPRMGRAIAAVVTILCFTLLHAWMMVALQPGSRISPHFSIATLELLFGFLWQFTLAGGQTFLPVAVTQTSGEGLRYVWAFGLLLLAAVPCGVMELFRRARAQPATFVLHIFSITAFFALFLLIVLREVSTRSVQELGGALANYTWGPRYVIPLHFVLLASGAALAARVARRLGRIAAPAFCALALSTSIAQVEFQHAAFRRFAPRSSISHDAIWQLILQTVQECRAHRLPVPDLPLDVLAQEFEGVTVRSVEPLLRADLKLAPTETIEMISWDTYATHDRAAYREIDALHRLEGELALPSKEREP